MVGTRFPAMPLPHLTPRSATRALVAGCAWGSILTAGFTAHAWSSCGIICIDDVLVTAAISMAAGIVAIGPLATLRR